MVMDPHLRGFSGYGKAPVIVDDGSLVPRFGNGFVDHDLREIALFSQTNTSFPRNSTSASTTATTSSGSLNSTLRVSPDEDFQDDCDFSDAVLIYINQILMEEDMEDKTCMPQDSLDLQAAERPFYEAIGKTYPPSPNPYNEYPPDGKLLGTYSSCVSAGFDGNTHLVYPSYQGEIYNPEVQSFPINGTHHLSPYSFSSGSLYGIQKESLLESTLNTLEGPNLYYEAQLASQFRMALAEKASKLLLSGGGSVFDSFGVDRFSHHEDSQWNAKAIVKEENKGDTNFPSSMLSRGKKNPHKEDWDIEEAERSSKQAAVYPDSVVRTQMFDDVLLCSGGKALSNFRESLQNEGSNKGVQQNGTPKGSSRSGKGRGKKRNEKKVVDLRTLLILCVQAVAADDRRTAYELLKQIRHHSSPYGDGIQRLAHCFADALDARLAGTGSQIYKSLVSKSASAAEILKAYHLYCAICPFRKLSNFFSNRTVINAAVNSNSSVVHIIDFGILYGFQWPTLIQRLSDRPGGPPMLRITGIEFPQPGFRPAERVEETGRRLANYAESFKVPFEYNAIAKGWDAISLEELKIDRDELIIVNCLYRFKNVHDESVAEDSARNAVLKLIRKINPDIFIHGILNGSFNAPFFVTRFREALFHFSALFDMLETNVPREVFERMLIEKEIFGREALNVIACEGWGRVERPETYKQWQVRNLRAGFVQLPLDEVLVRRATDRAKADYHKDFVIDKDGKWLLQGWKGRIIYALSSWKPV